jgi:hypothetical protein
MIFFLLPSNSFLIYELSFAFAKHLISTVPKSQNFSELMEFRYRKTIYNIAQGILRVLALKSIDGERKLTYYRFRI